ncbi:MAG: DinB family protein [Phycisphaeraceae bacterium]|nr:DinB family protein [Phycisphaeraceae bacterium]
MLNGEVMWTLFRYSDWADTRVLECSQGVVDEGLDRVIGMGPGSLRRTLLHIHAGEATWLRRWMDGREGGVAEPKWPAESERVGIGALRERFTATWASRDGFLGSLAEGDLGRVQAYRDSKGGVFRATLSDMVLQACLHSHHHRAQAVNMLRQVGGEAPEVDYMMWVREPA